MRRARETDFPGILECLAAAFEPYRREYTPDALADTTLTPAALAERFARMSIYVATDTDERVIGTVAWQATGDVGHLRGMAVSPEWQGSGVAGRLLETAEEDLRRRGCRRITLDTTAPLSRAVRFYEKHGFRSSGAVTDFFGMPLFEYSKDL